MQDTNGMLDELVQTLFSALDSIFRADLPHPSKVQAASSGDQVDLHELANCLELIGVHLVRR